MSYLFLHIDDEYINENVITTLSNYSIINIFHSKNYNISVNHPNVYVYCFTEEQIRFCIEKGYTYHICFYGNDILESSLFKYCRDNTELFWFPLPEDFTSTKQQLYATFFNNLKLPICISISSIFNPLSVSEENRLWIKKIYTLFSNPLYIRELEIMEHEEFHLDNHYIYQKNNDITSKNMVLGYMGDQVLNETPNFLNNSKTIFRTRDCSNCDYQEQCIKRGLGFIMKENQYKGCCGIKIFKP